MLISLALNCRLCFDEVTRTCVHLAFASFHDLLKMCLRDCVFELYIFRTQRLLRCVYFLAHKLCGLSTYIQKSKTFLSPLKIGSFANLVLGLKIQKSLKKFGVHASLIACEKVTNKIIKPLTPCCPKLIIGRLLVTSYVGSSTRPTPPNTHQKKKKSILSSQFIVEIKPYCQPASSVIRGH